MRIAVLTLVANAGLGIVLALLMGTPGIALATAIAAAWNAIALASALRRRIGPLLDAAARGDLGRMGAALLAAGAAGAWPYVLLLARWGSWGLGARLAATAALYAGIGLIYVAAGYFLGLRPLDRFARRGLG